LSNFFFARVGDRADNCRPTKFAPRRRGRRRTGPAVRYPPLPAEGMSLPDSDRPMQNRFYPLEAAAAWLLPGLGHILLGQRVRGLIIMVAILSLWVAGLFIGGITCINHGEHTAWFVGQALVAPTVAADVIRASVAAPPAGAKPDWVPPVSPNAAYEPSYGRPNEQGILFTALAGLLNLLAIIDVAYCDPDQRRHPQPAAADAPAQA
jgi:hypothetical protein